MFKTQRKVGAHSIKTMQNFLKTPINHLEMKTVMSEIFLKSHKDKQLNEINSQLNIAKDKINKSEGIATEMIQNETQIEKRLKKKKKKNITELWDNFRKPSVCATGVQQRTEQKQKKHVKK